MSRCRTPCGRALVGLGATSGSSPCCDQCGGDPRRTVEVDGTTHEAVPADVIIRAGLMAAASLVSPAA